MTENILLSFEERFQEIESYLDLLEALERQIQEGPPEIGGSIITTGQQRILYSSVYLQLYNLVEATVTWCIDLVCSATFKDDWKPSQLSDEMKKEWVKSVARTNTPLTAENRLQTVLDLCHMLFDASAIPEWNFTIGGGGNWDDHQIENLSQRIGVDLRLSSSVLTNVKRLIRDDFTALKLIKDLRNRLAHGSLSFTECGEGVTVSDLRNISETTGEYLREVVGVFQDHVDSLLFLNPSSRTSTVGT